jgi:HPt (histidine-containing phosphotransfer) domain-containing protein
MNRQQPPIVFDRAAALERVEGDETLLREIAVMFLETADELLGDVRNAVVQRDSAALYAAAHTLKGVVANFSATTCYEAALALEMKGRNQDLMDAETGLLRLQLATASLRTVLEQYVHEAAA